jgi:serine-type D-Ala-D-Ala carboxypeptidase/endopeptidase (penicillin-binding protein 4)
MTRRRLAAPILFLVLVAWLPIASAGGERSGHRRARSPIKSTARRAVARDVLRRSSTHKHRSEPSTPEGRLRDELHAIWAGRALRRGTTAVYVVDARTGEDIYSVHPDDRLNPASNVKLVSTATVLDLMGPDWRYLTRVFGPAPDGRGVARGDVYLRGNYDPSLTRNGLEELAKDVAGAGVKRIEGDVVLSDDLLRDTVADQNIKIQVKAGAQPGAPAIVSLDRGDSFVQVHVTATTTASRRARLEISSETLVASPSEGAASDGAGPKPARAAPAFLLKVGGTIRLGRSGTYWRSLGLRSTFTGHAVRAALRAAGVQVSGGVRLADFDTYNKDALAAGFLPVELGRHSSRSMNELVARVNKRSLNWLADRLLMTAGAEAKGGGAPSMEDGLEAMYQWLERSGVDRKKVIVDTGSGLSHKTKITVRQLVRVLRAAAGYSDKDKDKDKDGEKDKVWSKGFLDPALYLASLAIGGVDGTLRGRFRGESLRGRVLGKTGTLRDSVALSGFVSGDGDRALCFAIVTNGNRWSARARIRREHEQMVAAMKRYLDTRAEQDASRLAAKEEKAEKPEKEEDEADESPAGDDAAARAAEQAAKAAKLSKPLTSDGERESDDAEAAEERQGSETTAGVSETDEQDEGEDEERESDGDEAASPPPISTP